MYKFVMMVPSILALTVATACAANSEVVKNDVQKSNLISQSYLKPGAAIGYAHDLKSQYNAGETVNFQLNLGESTT